MSTTLAHALAASDQTVTLSDAEDLTSGQLLAFDAEYCRVLVPLTPTQAIVQRGVNGTQSSAHAAGVAVTIDVPENFLTGPQALPAFGVDTNVLTGLGPSFAADFLPSTGGGGTPSAPFTSVQFNNAGTFGGSADFTWDGTHALVGGSQLITFTDLAAPPSGTPLGALASPFDRIFTGPPESTLPALLQNYFRGSNLFTALSEGAGTIPAVGIEAERFYGLGVVVQGPNDVLQTGPIGIASEAWAGADNFRVYAYSAYTDANGHDIGEAFGYYAYKGGLTGGSADRTAAYFNQNMTGVAGVGKDFSWYSEGGTGHFETGAADYVGVEIEKATGQTAHLMDFLGDDGVTVLSYVAANGLDWTMGGTVTATDFIVTGSRFKSDTVDGHTAGLSGYDVGNATYRDILTWTNGNAVAAILATPVGGTLSIDASSLSQNGKSITLSGNLTTTGAFNPTFAIPSNSTWTFPSGGGTLSTTAGTVTSVAASVPGFLSVAGSPITSSGTLAISYSGTALPVANGGTAATSASIAAFNNITGLSAAGTTGTTSTNLVFSTSPALTTPSITTSGTLTNDAIAAVSTDGFVLQNTTPATSLATVQQSPRLRLRSQVWNTTSVAATNTNDFFIESVPLSGSSPSGVLKVGSSLNGAAATYPLTLSSTGGMILLGGVTVSDGSGMIWSTRGGIGRPANGVLQVYTAGFSSFVEMVVAATASLQLGQDVNGAAVSQTFQAANGITGTDKTGGNLTLASGKGTGAGAVSSLLFQTPTVLGSGTTAQSLATRLTLTSAGATFAAGITTLGGATFHTTSSALTDGAGVGLGTLGTAPAAGNPTKWIGINDNGTTRYIPAW